jgi:DDE superfamily endonuclease
LALWRELTEAGLCDLWYLDESGFAPTLPTGYTWARVGARPLVWDEPPAGRRLNVLGALAPFGAERRLAWTCPAGKLDSAALLGFVWREVAGLPAPPERLPAGYRRARPCVIALDNASAHVSAAVKAALPILEAAGVLLYYLPPYSPELNRIEELWRQAKYQDLPVRSYRTLEDLRAAVEDALGTHAARLRDATDNFAEAA